MNVYDHLYARVQEKHQRILQEASEWRRVDAVSTKGPKVTAVERLRPIIATLINLVSR